MINQEPFFLANNFLEKEKKELEHILEVVQGKQIKNYERATFLRNFTNQLFRAYRKTKDHSQQDKKKSEKEFLEKKKQELLKKLEEAQNKNSKHETSTLTEGKSLIFSKDTGKTLVKTEFDGKIYLVKEPELIDQDNKILNELKGYKLEDLHNQLKNLCNKYNIEFSDGYYDKIRYFIIRNKKYGKISPLIEDKDVKEIVCNGKEKLISITYKDNKEIPTNIKFNSDEDINNFIKIIASRTKQKIDNEKPFLNIIIGKMNISANISTEFLKPKFIIIKRY